MKSERVVPVFINNPVSGQFIRCVLLKDVPEDQKKPLTEQLGKAVSVSNEEPYILYSEYSAWYNSWVIAE